MTSLLPDGAVNVSVVIIGLEVNGSAYGYATDSNGSGDSSHESTVLSSSSSSAQFSSSYNAESSSDPEESSSLPTFESSSVPATKSTSTPSTSTPSTSAPSITFSHFSTSSSDDSDIPVVDDAATLGVPVFVFLLVLLLN